ncbi:hypothetical protein BKA56DRAFT_626273 [Ilyonectria sp. MPI-CAGE-AT-0026]|nr:hypothetical protein BKA56DRAFT_626273 [Ilyonectria sp. MPI-CAGE-AT-0026]
MEILITEVQTSTPDSTRQLRAIARVNFLYSQYRKEGQIRNEDMLHMLGDAIAEIFRVIDTHKWRKLTNTKRCAIGLFHKNFGEALEINFAILPSNAQGWENGLYFSQKLEE